MKFGSSFTDIFENKSTLFYQVISRFDIFSAHCLGGYFFRGHSAELYKRSKMHLNSIRKVYACDLQYKSIV